MIDTLNLRLEKSFSQSDLNDLRNRLDDPGEHFPQDGYFITGRLKNLSITAGITGLSIKKGSLAKYFLNDNIQTLTRSTLEQAINQLSEELELSLNQAKITRVDIGCNFLMKFKPESYLHCLLECPSYKRKPYDHGVYFGHGTKTKVFYDKIEDCKVNKVEVPVICKGRNLLRYEFRLLGRIADFFQVDEFTAKDLYQEANYMKMIDEYHRQYENIVKKKTLSPDIPENLTVKSFKDYLFNLAVYELGSERAYQEYNFFKKNKKFKQAADASRAKKEIKKVFSGDKMKDSELIEELNQKIKALKFNYR